MRKKKNKKQRQRLFDRSQLRELCFRSFRHLSVFHFFVSSLPPSFLLRRRAVTIPLSLSFSLPSLRRHFIPLSPDVKWVAAGSMGAQRRARCDVVVPWELSAARSLHGGGVGGHVPRREERRETAGRGGRSFPLRISHLARHRTGANVKRFRDVKADTRVAHFGPTTSLGYAGTHVRYLSAVCVQPTPSSKISRRSHLFLASSKRVFLPRLSLVLQQSIFSPPCQSLIRASLVPLTRDPRDYLLCVYTAS